MKRKNKVIISILAISATLALGAFMGGCSLSDKIKQWRCDHENITENVVIDPTCYEEGELKETCDNCGKTWTEDIAKVAHTWNDGEVVVEATCTETGIARYTCTVEGCEAVEDRVTDKLEHTRVEMPAVAPTCTTVGYTEWYKCGDCGLVLTKKQELPALGHVETELKAVAPTCTETGLTAGVGCATCGEVITAQTVVPATGHNLVTVAGKPATCTEAGLTDGQACETCGTVYVEQKGISATGHIYIDVKTNGFQDDYLYEECSACGNVYTPETLGLDTTPFASNCSIGGNWYRFYKSTFSSLGKDSISFSTDTGVSFWFFNSSHTTYQGFKMHVSGQPENPESFGVKYYETEEYIDFFIHLGEYSQSIPPSGEIKTVEITEETVFEGEGVQTIDLHIIVDNRIV